MPGEVEYRKVTVVGGPGWLLCQESSEYSRVSLQLWAGQGSHCTRRILSTVESKFTVVGGSGRSLYQDNSEYSRVSSQLWAGQGGHCNRRIVSTVE